MATTTPRSGSSSSNTEEEQEEVIPPVVRPSKPNNKGTKAAVTSVSNPPPSSSSATVDTASPKQQRRSFSQFWHRHVYLRLCATANVPFLSMAINLIIYGCLCYCFRQNLWISTVLIAYLLFCILEPAPRQGGYNSWGWSQANMERVRHAWFLKGFAEFFPVSLIKTAELNPDQGPYILLYHPHGVIGIGACCALICNACGFDTTFPGLRRRCVTLNICFSVPFFREWILFLGMISADKQSLVHCLTKRGESICLVPGGATEALYAQEGTFVCYLNKRKGFIRLALETNAKLVPVIGFGENGAFSSVSLARTIGKSSIAARIQHALTKWFTFSMPVLSSPFPRIHPIHVVVGAPVEFSTATNAGDVDECHALYLQALQDLYNTHKADYGHENIPLEIH